jgi:predicted glycosyltransferase
MHYAHDSYGLGHVSRTLAIARRLRECSPGGVAQLVVSGSPVEPPPSRVPEGTDLLRLPSAVKVGAERYEPRRLSGSFESLRDLRAEVVCAAARSFRPHLLLVDHAPAGLGREIVSTLRELRTRAPATRLVVGLRDIVDDAASVRGAWMRAGVYGLLDDVYDLILVYGDREVYDPVVEYGLSRRAAAKVRYVGYLGRHRSPAKASQDSGPSRRVLATAGGGEDGYGLFRALLAGLHRRPRSFDTTVVTGPLMRPGDRTRLERLAAASEAVEMRSHVDDLETELARSSAVVSMGGYNSLCEILTQGVPAVIVPRVTPRREQLIRAQAFERRGLIHVIHPDELTPGRMLSEVDAALGEERRQDAPLPLDGLDHTAAALTEALDSRPHISAGARERAG